MKTYSQMARKNWTEFETEAALELYLRTPFGRIHSRNPEIIALAQTLDRTPGSIALKLANFASLDESLPRKGMSKTSSLDRSVWTAFFNALTDAGSANFQADTESALSAQDRPQAEFEYGGAEGLDTIRLGKVRLNQNLFRKMVLSAYDNRCAVTGIARPELLIAGHIKPWAIDPENRLNPRNGICLNRLHDAAFETGLLTFTDNGKIVYSSQLDDPTKSKLDSISDGQYLRQPHKFRPNPDFLEYHRDVKFVP